MHMPPVLHLPGAHRLGAMARTGLAWLLVLLLLALAGCAQPPRATPSEAGHWSGRLALQIEGQSAQSFSAGFELQGNADQGELTLYTPLGGVLARLQWQPGQALLQSGNETQSAHSLDGLLQLATGTPIPVAALFAWLAGEHAPAQGWQADLSGLDQGRLVAQRHAPEPRATLRIALER